MSNNKEISLATVRKIANEELKNYIGKKFTEDVTPENVLESLTKTDKNILRKAYKETLIKSFEEKIRILADEHGKQYAQELFEQYLSKVRRK